MTLVDYHEDKTEILCSVTDLVTEARMRGSRYAAAKRGWRGGPHVTIRISDPTLDPDAVEDARRRLNASVPDGAIAQWDEGHYRRYADRADGGQGPLPPLSAQGKWSVTQYPCEESEIHELEYLTAVSPAILEKSLLRADRNTRMLAAAELMLGTASAYPGGAAFGYLSFRSHAEAFLAQTPRTDLRQRWSRLAAQPMFDLLIRDALETDVADLPGRMGYGYRAAAESAHSLSREMVELLLGDAPVRTEDSQHEPSAFHAALRSGSFWRDPPVAFLKYRVVLNWLYGQLQNLGLTPSDRYALCFLIAETMERVTATTWRERLAQSPRSG